MHLGQSQAREGEKGSNESAEQCQDQLKGQLGYRAPVEAEEESKACSPQGKTKPSHTWFNPNPQRHGILYTHTLPLY